MNSAIVYKIGPKNKQGTGTVKPVVLVKDGQVPRPVAIDDFPNSGEILITHGYEDKIEVTSQSQLVRISFSENNYSNVDSSASYYCKYMAEGYDAENLSNSEYPHVISEAFDINKRQIKISYRPERHIILSSPSQEYMYGPFAYNDPEPLDDGTFQIELKPCDRLQGFDSPNYNILRFAFGAFPIVSVSGEHKILLTDVKGILETDCDVLDFIPDDKLINFANGLLSKDKLEKSQLVTFKSALTQITDSNQAFDEERSQRLLSLVDRVDYWSSQSSSLINNFLKSDEGNAKVDEYISEHKSDFDDNLTKIAGGKIEERRKQLQETINDLESSKQLLKNEVDTLNTEKRSAKQEIEESQTEPLKFQLAQLQVEIDSKTKERNTLIEETILQQDIKGLQKEKDRLDILIDDKKKQEGELKASRDILIEQIRQNDEQRKKELIRVATEEKVYLDILNGIAPVWLDTKTETKRTINPRQDKPSAAIIVKEVVRALEEYYGRNCSFGDIANLLICIDQSFLTVISGLPGVGKTSLVTCLANILGLKSQDCFLSIPTARGFTSQRDILGFHNPLSQRFQPAATGLYEILSELRADPSRANFPHWVLLDEANLSPMEHYFSTFLGMCDLPFDDNSKTIKTGEQGKDRVLIIPASFRFLATINYDNTTEPLSPRMIDRVPIIRIEPPKEENLSFKSVDLPESPMLSYAELHNVFCVKPTEIGDESLTFEERKVLNSVKAALSSTDIDKGIPTIVSPRKLKAIQQYCMAARQLMRDEGSTSSLTAMDYAICQHILPLINGNSKKYRKRLEELKKAVGSLDRSRTMLENIIQTGEDEQDFYRFFI